MTKKILLFLVFMMSMCISTALDRETKLRVFNRVIETNVGITLETFNNELELNIKKLLHAISNVSEIERVCDDVSHEKLFEIILYATLGKFVATDVPGQTTGIQYDAVSNKFISKSSTWQKKIEILKLLSVVLVILSARLWHLSNKQPLLTN